MRGERFREPIHALSLHDVIILTKPGLSNAKKESDNTRSGPISIIVPVLNETATIERFLKCLSERTERAEISVDDGCSTAGTFVLAQRHCVRFLRTSPGRSVQINSGARTASSDTLWFLH